MRTLPAAAALVAVVFLLTACASGEAPNAAPTTEQNPVVENVEQLQLSSEAGDAWAAAATAHNGRGLLGCPKGFEEQARQIYVNAGLDVWPRQMNGMDHAKSRSIKYNVSYDGCFLNIEGVDENGEEIKQVVGLLPYQEGQMDYFLYWWGKGFDGDNIEYPIDIADFKGEDAWYTVTETHAEASIETSMRVTEGFGAQPGETDPAVLALAPLASQWDGQIMMMVETWRGWKQG